MIGGKKRLKFPLLRCLALTLFVIFNKPMGQFDRAWSDILLASEKSPSSQQYMIVDITAHDIDTLGGPSFPREVLAKTLMDFHNFGANRIIIDLGLSKAAASKSDPLLMTALESLGPERVAIPLEADPKFKPYASSIDLSLLADQDGWTRNVRTQRTSTGHNPARWLSSGQLSNEDVKIDQRYDPSKVKRMTLGEFLENGEMDISGSNIILSPDASVLASRIRLPLSEKGDRSAAIILGSQSVSNDYETTAKKSWWVSVILAFTFMGLGVLLAGYINSVRLLILNALAVSVIAVAVNIFMMKLLGGPGYPVMQFICFLVGLFVTIGSRLRLFQMIATFLKGDLSPEEAWTWRSYEDNASPVILLDAMGNIRRMNGAAQKISNLLGSGFGKRCFFESRQNSNEISVQDQQHQTHHFTIDWPNPSVPLVLLKDVTQTARQVDDLESHRRNLQKSIEDLRHSQSQAVELAGTYEQEKSRAEAASQLKSEFLANMSHELRTPLNAINGFSDIMRRELFGPLGDPRYKEFAADILFSGQHLLSLINDILDLSKIEAGKKELSCEAVQISDLIGQAVRMSHIKAKNKGVNLVCDETQFPKVYADPRAVKQIVLNLLTNAIKFTPEGGLVTVSVQDQSTYVIVAVIDTGIGISQENIEKLAQPFAQVDNEETKNQEGTGLGLSLAKSLVELHGGKFKIESTVGEGTAMMFSLPYMPVQHQAVVA